jgi:hypothetical protein
MVDASYAYVLSKERTGKKQKWFSTTSRRRPENDLFVASGVPAQPMPLADATATRPAVTTCTRQIYTHNLYDRFARISAWAKQRAQDSIIITESDRFLPNSPVNVIFDDLNTVLERNTALSLYCVYSVSKKRARITAIIRFPSREPV